MVPGTPQIDGGRNALAGFLYQIVGVLGLKAVASTHSMGGEDELDALVSVAKEGRLEHERFGQDAVLSEVLENGEGLSLVQFKFSPLSPPRPIEPGEFGKIVERLAVSKEQAEGEGKLVSGIYLITNRPYTPKGRPGSAVTVSGSNTPAREKPSGGKGKPKKATRGDHLREMVRESLHVISSVPLSTWRETLERFARTFGCLDSEMESGVDRLVGSIQRRTLEEGRVAIEKEHLIEAFTDSTSTKPLAYPDTKSYCAEGVSNFSDLVVPRGQAVRRKILDDIDREIVQNALVILDGPGGNGKSTVLATWARMTLEAPPPKPGLMISVRLASQIRPSWVREVVCDLAEIPRVGHSRRSETARDAINRLVIANPGCVRPVLLLGLDGLDEGAEFADRRQAIEEILNWFWREDQQAKDEGRLPDATLVVTCRRSQEVIENFLYPTVSGFVSGGRRPKTLPVKEFSLSELLDAVSRSLPDLYDRFYAAVVGSDAFLGDSYDDLAVVLNPVQGSGPLIGSDTLEALRHPAVWRALIELPDEVRERVLSDDPVGARSLAREFTHWFCRKARTRRFKDRCLEELLEVLSSISVRSPGAGAKDYRSGWFDPALASGIFGDREVLALYDEAASAGYILKDALYRWHWRHLMCPDYLSSTRAPD